MKMTEGPDGEMIPELNEREAEIVELRDHIISHENIGEAEAAKLALAAMPNPDPEFAEWLGVEA